MAESTIQHQPAMKVAGRRLSVTMRHKSHAAGERISPEAEDKTQGSAPADYPRPAPPTEHVPHTHIHHQYEEEAPPRKDNKKHEAERKMQEFVQRKTETTRPTRDPIATQKNQSIRISQPAGKSLQV